VNVCNNIINGDVSAISLNASAPNNYIEKINISGNIVTIDTGSCFYTETQPDSKCIGGISITDNTFSSTDKTKSNRGVSLDMYGLLLLKPSIMNNRFINLNKGIASFRETGNSVENFLIVPLVLLIRLTIMNLETVNSLWIFQDGKLNVWRLLESITDLMITKTRGLRIHFMQIG
jgi:hypothetical protein